MIVTKQLLAKPWNANICLLSSFMRIPTNTLWWPKVLFIFWLINIKTLGLLCPTLSLNLYQVPLHSWWFLCSTLGNRSCFCSVGYALFFFDLLEIFHLCQTCFYFLPSQTLTFSSLLCYQHSLDYFYCQDIQTTCVFCASDNFFLIWLRIIIIILFLLPYILVFAS